MAEEKSHSLLKVHFSLTNMKWISDKFTVFREGYKNQKKTTEKKVNSEENNTNKWMERKKKVKKNQIKSNFNESMRSDVSLNGKDRLQFVKL